MKNQRTKLLQIVLSVLGLVVVGAGIAWLLEPKEQGRENSPPARAEALAARPALPPRPAVSRETAQPALPAPRPAKKSLISPPVPPSEPASVAAPEAPPPPAPPETKLPPKAKEPIQDPVARLALSLVGTDDEAEVIWLAAINNPELPANERKDLIEDLNEDGFPDPKHLTAEDVPLIHSRILLIERLAPEAMDRVNAAAFVEAHQDLVKMLARAAQQ